MLYDKKKIEGKDKVIQDELKGIVELETSNETDLTQCPVCKTLHNQKINHKCYDLPYFSWACAICNRETSKYVKSETGYLKVVEKRKTVRIWGKPVCEDCIFRAYKELKK